MAGISAMESHPPYLRVSCLWFSHSSLLSRILLRHHNRRRLPVYYQLNILSWKHKIARKLLVLCFSLWYYFYADSFLALTCLWYTELNMYDAEGKTRWMNSPHINVEYAIKEPIPDAFPVTRRSVDVSADKTPALPGHKTAAVVGFSYHFIAGA